MTWIQLHVLAFHPLERLRWSLLWISSLPMGLSPSYIFWWQLMWWVTTDVAISVCGRSGLWPFRFVAFPVCGRFGLWPFRFVAVSVCGRFGLWPFQLWPFRSVAVMTCCLSKEIHRLRLMYCYHQREPKRFESAMNTSCFLSDFYNFTCVATKPHKSYSSPKTISIVVMKNYDQTFVNDIKNIPFSSCDIFDDV